MSVTENQVNVTENQVNVTENQVPVTEVKRHITGREVRFDLQLVQRRPHVVVARYVHPEAFERDGFAFERGSVSYGFFWKRRSYVMYRMLDRHGRLVANRFDVVEEVRLTERTVSYTDLLLDAWATPDGSFRFEDEDEVAEAFQAGLLSREQLDTIEKTKDRLLRRHKAIAREAARLLSQ